MARIFIPENFTRKPWENNPRHICQCQDSLVFEYGEPFNCKINGSDKIKDPNLIELNMEEDDQLVSAVAFDRKDVFVPLFSKLIKQFDPRPINIAGKDITLYKKNDGKDFELKFHYDVDNCVGFFTATEFIIGDPCKEKKCERWCSRLNPLILLGNWQYRVNGIRSRYEREAKELENGKETASTKRN